MPSGLRSSCPIVTSWGIGPRLRRGVDQRIRARPRTMCRPADTRTVVPPTSEDPRIIVAMAIPRRRPSRSAPDVAVVGGGILGVSLAAQLAETGRRVLLLERAELGAGASGRNSGIVQHPL